MSLTRLNSNFDKLPKTFPEELIGQWTAVLNGKVISHSENFKEVFKEVAEKGYTKQVLFHKVPKKEIIIV